MRTQPQQFPHIYRFLTAKVDFILQKYASLPSDKKQLLINILPFIAIILFLMFSVFSPSTDFERAKLFVLKNPKDARAHLVLAQIFKKNNNLIEAAGEAAAANYFDPNNEEIKNEMALLSDLKTKPTQLEKDLAYWQKITLEKNNYRDAFLQKASLEYQLRNTTASIIDLQKALELDPNYDSALKMRKLLEK